MSDNVGSVIFGSGMVENVGVAVGIASLTLAVGVLFPLPVFTSGFEADILGFRCWTMSGCVDSAISRSGTVENVGVAVGIFSPPPSIQKLFPLPAFTSGFHFRFRGRRFVFPMLADVGTCRQCHFESGIVKNDGVAVGIASLTLSVQLIFPLPVSTSGSVSDISGF